MTWARIFRGRERTFRGHSPRRRTVHTRDSRTEPLERRALLAAAGGVGLDATPVDWDAATAAVTPQGLVADRFEANDTFATARNLGAAGDRSFPDLSIHVPNNDDYYRLTASGGGNLTVTLNFTHAAGDVDMQLLDGAGTVLASSAGTGNSETITRTGVTGGEVFVVRVYGYSGAANPDYAMTVDGPDIFPDRFEPNDSRAAATNFGALGDRNTSGLNIHASGNDDYYQFTAGSSAPFTAGLTFSHALGDVDVQLLDSGGAVLASSTSTTDAENITFAVTAGQTYYLRVYGFNGAINPSYNLNLNGPDLPPDRFEANDTFTTAMNLGAAGDRSYPDLNIHAPGNDDYYRLTTARAGDLTITLNFTHAFGDVDMQLLDSAGAVLTSSAGTGNSETVTRTGVTAGQVYYVRVYGFSGMTNPDYDMTVNGPDIPPDTFEPNDTRATARNFGTLGDRIANGLSIHASGNDDYYQFTAGATGNVAIGLAFSHALGDVDMQLMDSNGAVLAASQGSTDAETINFAVTAGQTYYLRVWGFAGAINPSYNMNINAPDFPPDRFEANDTFATARNLGAAGDRSYPDLSIHAGGNEDYYRLTTAGSGNLTVSLAFTHAFGDVDMQLLDSAGAVLSTSSGTGNSESVTRSVGANEVYYVRVYGFSGMTNPDYDMTVNGPDIPPDWFEPNDTRLTATNFGTLGDRTANGLSIHASGNDDYYQFTAGAAGPLIASLAFSHALGDVDMQLLDSGGAVLSTSNSTTDAETISSSVVAGQTYYLRVYGFAGAINPRYNMTINGPDLPPDRFEANDTFATARNLGAAGDRSFPDLNIHAANNDDYYRLTTTGNGDLTVTLNFTHAFGDVDMQLLDSAGAVLATSASLGNSETVTRTGVAAGQVYHVRVYGFSGMTNPDYDMTVDGPDIPADRFEPNNSLATATDFETLGHATENFLSIHQSGNADYYRFVAGSSGTLNVNLSFTHALGDVDVQLLDSTGSNLAISDSTTDAETISFGVTGGQAYYLYVYGYNGAINPRYDLTISGPELPRDRFEPNDTLATARNLGAAGDRTFPDLTLHATGNDDYYRLTTVAAGTLTVGLAFHHVAGDVDMQLLDAAGTVLATSAGIGNGESISRQVAAGEEYFVRVYGFQGDTNPDYDMTVDGPDIAPDRFEPNDSLANAAELGTLGDRIENNLSIHRSGNDDYYRFTPAAAGTVAVSLAFTHALGDVDVQLLDGAGAVLAFSNSTTDAESINFAVAAGQTYYLRVYGFNGAINPDYDMTIDGPALPTVGVVGRYVFYNRSSFDGGDPDAGAADDGSIATDKAALLPGQRASFANVTSYSRGINGIMIDVAGLQERTLRLEDFAFELGDGSRWSRGPAVRAFDVRTRAGTGRSDRFTFVFSDNAIQNTWVRVTLVGYQKIGLREPDVFYFGNLIAESGDLAGGALRQTPMDLAHTRRALSPTAAINSRYDFNRDGRVSPADVAIARAAVMQHRSLVSFTAPAARAPALPPTFWAVDTDDELLAPLPA